MSYSYSNIINKAKFREMPNGKYITRSYPLEYGKRYQITVQFHSKDLNREKLVSNIFSFDYLHQVII